MGRDLDEPPRRQERQGRKGLCFLKLISDSADAVLDQSNVEIDEKTKRLPGKLEALSNNPGPSSL
jgi:hypothetical protein